jgi:hypothetical protein
MADKFTLNNFHPQAYLLFLDFTRENSLKKSAMNAKPNEPAVHKLIGNYRPQSVMSKVYNGKDTTGKKLIKEHFFNLETHKISALIPEIRFYKTEGEAYLPFYFPISTIADEAAVTSGFSRTKGSGIKSFTVKYEGTDPFQAPRYLRADLTLYVDNLANLFDVVPGFAPLADLFTISIARGAQKKEINGATVTSGDLARPIEVAATLGYTIPSGRTGIFTQEEIREIQTSNLSLRMNVFHHDISVNQDGSAEIAIQYTARIDNTARNKIFSTTDNPVDILRRANIRQLFAQEEKDIESTDKKKEDKILSSTRKNQIDKSIEIRKVLEILERTNRIHSVDTDESSFLIYTDMGVPNLLRAAAQLESENEIPIDDFGPDETEESKLLTEKAKSLNNIISELDKSKRRVHYITFGDLLEAFFFKTLLGLIDALNILDLSAEVSVLADVLEKSKFEREAIAANLGIPERELTYLVALSQKSQSEKDNIRKTLLDATKKLSTFRVLLADVEYKHFTEFEDEESVKRINIADIPIALETYQEFMFDTIVNSYRNTYTIPQFLNDCVSSLLPKVFGKNWSNAGIASKVISAPPKFTSVTYTGPELRDSLASRKELEPGDIPSAQKDFRAKNIKDEADYFVIFQSLDRELAGDRSGNVNEDSRDGIYHFLLGKNRGLIKEISFSRFNVDGAQEQLMTNQVGLYDELKLPYTAQVSMVGNNLFIPGSQVFVNPGNIGFGSATDVNSPAFKIGLGGYYTVIDVQTTFDGQKLTTDLGLSFGAHAKDTDGLSGITRDVRVLGDIQKSNTSNDAEPQEIPEFNSSLIEVPQSHYLTQLRNLKYPENGQPVVDDVLARDIANDFVLNKESNVVAIPGVLGKGINPRSGAVRYNLQRGEVIEIDDTRPSSRAVSLIASRRAQSGE